MAKVIRKTVFSTGDIAALIGVSTTSIRRWIEEENDIAYIELPGGAMQVYRQGVLKFFEKRGLSLDEIEEHFYEAKELTNTLNLKSESDALQPAEEDDGKCECGEDYGDCECDNVDG